MLMIIENNLSCDFLFKKLQSNERLTIRKKALSSIDWTDFFFKNYSNTSLFKFPIESQDSKEPLLDAGLKMVPSG